MEQGAYDVKYPGLDDTIFRALRCLRASAVMRLLCKSMAPVAAAINPSELHLKLFSVPARQSVPLPTVTEAEEIEDEHEHSVPRSGALGCRCQPRPWQTRIRSPVSLRVLARRWVSRWRLRLPCGRVAAAAPGTWAFSFAASMSIDLCHRAWAISVERVYLHTRGWVESAAGELLGVQTFHKSGEASFVYPH